MDQQMFEIKYQMKLQSSVIESCFKDCVNGFREEQLTNGEKSCIQNCGKRYMGAFMAFGEVQQGMQQQQRGGAMGQF